MTRKPLSGTLLDDQITYTLSEVCHVCGSQSEWIIELVEEGILQPAGEAAQHWTFAGSNVHRAMKARRLQKDLGLNVAGVALVLELLDEVGTLRSRLAAQDRHSG